MSSITHSYIEYNPTAKRWEVMADNPKDFPAGAEGRLAARLYRISQDQPALYAALVDIARAHDQNSHRLLWRLVRAAELVEAGAVLKNTDTYGTVTSQDGKCRYHPYRGGVPLMYRCSCPDHIINGGVATAYSGRTCKHILALQLHYFTNHTHQPRLIPDDDEARATFEREWQEKLERYRARLPAEAEEPLTELERWELDELRHEQAQTQIDETPEWQPTSRSFKLSSALAPDPVNLDRKGIL